MKPEGTAAACSILGPDEKYACKVGHLCLRQGGCRQQGTWQVHGRQQRRAQGRCRCMLAQGAGQVQVHSMQHRNGREIWGACSTAAGSRRRRRKKEGARAGGGLSSAHRKISRGGAYIGMERGFLACALRKTAGLGLRGSGCGEKKEKRETGRTTGLGRKDFFLFSFFFAKRFNKFDLNFKPHKLKFKSNHKQ